MVSGKSITSPPHTDARTPREQGAAGERQEGTPVTPSPATLQQLCSLTVTSPRQPQQPSGHPHRTLPSSPAPALLCRYGKCSLPSWEAGQPHHPLLGGRAAPPSWHSPHIHSFTPPNSHVPGASVPTPQRRPHLLPLEDMAATR